MRAAAGTLARAPGHAASSGEVVKTPVRWAFYLFVASLPFDMPDKLPVEITTLTGAVFILTTMLQPGVCYFRRVPGAVWLFALYPLAFGIAFAMGGGGHFIDVIRQFVMFSQLLLILWAASNLLRDERIAATSLLLLAAGCTIVGALQLVADAPGGVRHVRVLGQNANRTAVVVAVGALSLLGLTYGRERSIIRPRFLVLIPLAIMALSIVRGGSRGGFLALVLGLAAFAMAGRSMVSKVRNAAIVFACTVGFVGLALSSPVMRERFDMAGEGNMAGREEIFPTAWEMFTERPLAGWGPTANKYELALRLPHHEKGRRDTHNLILEVLTATGTIGAIPFFLAVALCAFAAWSARRGPHGMLPVALMLTLLLANLSGNHIAFKIFWLVMAFSLAAAAPALGSFRWDPATAGGNGPLLQPRARGPFRPGRRDSPPGRGLVRQSVAPAPRCCANAPHRGGRGACEHQSGSSQLQQYQPVIGVWKDSAR